MPKWYVWIEEVNEREVVIEAPDQYEALHKAQTQASRLYEKGRDTGTFYRASDYAEVHTQDV